MKIVHNIHAYPVKRIGQVKFGSVIGFLTRPPYFPSYRYVEDIQNRYFLLTLDYFKDQKAFSDPNRRMLCIVDLENGQTVGVDPDENCIVFPDAVADITPGD